MRRIVSLACIVIGLYVLVLASIGLVDGYRSGVGGAAMLYNLIVNAFALPLLLIVGGIFGWFKDR